MTYCKSSLKRRVFQTEQFIFYVGLSNKNRVGPEFKFREVSSCLALDSVVPTLSFVGTT
jgi:hypothetical protein